MVVAAYVAGLMTTPALFLGVTAGLRWWLALRRAQGHTATEPALWPPMVTPEPPTPSPPQDGPVLGRVRFGAMAPGRRRVRGRRI